MQYYAGIGPRKTEKPVQLIMTNIAKQLSPTGWFLRSGHAIGADQAFERGAINKQIYLPWEGFNNAYSNYFDKAVRPYDHEQLTIAQKHHPAWWKCSEEARQLLARNVPIILGEFLDEPVKCVITNFHPGYSGGTIHACNIAKSYDIPIFNIFHTKDQNDLCKFIWDIENS